MYNRGNIGGCKRSNYGWQNQPRIFWILLLENRSPISHSMVWHIIWANILLIVNIIFTDGIRMFSENAYLKIEIEAKCKITVFYFFYLFLFLSYERTFCSLLVFFLAPLELEKILRNSQNIRTYYMLNHRIRRIYCRDVFLLLHLKHFLFNHVTHYLLIFNW